MEILTSVRRLSISFKSLVNDFVYSFGRAALLLLVEAQNHTVPVRERRRIRVNIWRSIVFWNTLFRGDSCLVSRLSFKGDVSICREWASTAMELYKISFNAYEKCVFGPFGMFLPSFCSSCISVLIAREILAKLWPLLSTDLAWFQVDSSRYLFL